MKILIVDDSLTHRSILRNHLRHMGFTDFEQAGSGVEGLEKIDGADLILTDLNMPELHGLDFIKRIRTRNKKAFIVVITSDSDKDVLVDAIHSGANGFILKPYSLDMIEEKLCPFLR